MSRLNSIPRILTHHAEKHREKVAFSGPGWAITYADLEKRTRRVAIHLVRAGIARGNIVAIVLGRCLWAIESVLAILRAELAKILGHSGAGVIITDGRHLATVRAAAREA
ncbi:AMP-binding enzyme [Hirsutella rhossiliensis]